MQSEYRYDARGEGVREDLVRAVLDQWAGIDPYGDPAGPLRLVDQGAINRVDNLARLAALAVASVLEADEQAEREAAEVQG